MNLLGKVGAGAAVALFGVWFYATPYIAMKGAQRAANEGDAAKLSTYVDFPVLKANLKTTLAATIASQNKADLSNPMQAMGLAIANAFIDPIVEVMVTPQNLALMFQGKGPDLDKANKGKNNSLAGTSADGDITTSAGYESYDRFVIKIKNGTGPKNSLTLVLNREGFANWKLAGIRLPLENDSEVAPQASNTETAPAATVDNSSANTQQPSTQASLPISQNEPMVQGQSPSFSPSFDCAKVSTGAERLICSNQSLSAADVKLSQAYQAKRETSTDKEQLKKEQILWRKTVRDACSDVGCMLTAYQQRTAQLSR